MKTKIAVVFGGTSEEYEVSIASARGVLSVIEELDNYEAVPVGITKKGNWVTGDGAMAAIIEGADEDKLFVPKDHFEDDDPAKPHAKPPYKAIEQSEYALLLTHGCFGEDGRLQGLFEMLGAEIIGCSVLSSAVCFDKAFLKTFLEGQGFKVSPGVDFYIDQTDITEEFYKKLLSDLETDKLVIKPSDNGSSIGLSMAKSFEEFKKGIDDAAKVTNHVLVEKFISHREIVIGAIEDGEDLIISDLGESNESGENVYSYEEKYIQNDACKTPAKLKPELEKELIKQTKEIFYLTRSQDWTRIDFFIEDETDEIYFNEINTIPGMSKPSVFPQIFMSKGYTYQSLIKHILDNGTGRLDKESKMAA